MRLGVVGLGKLGLPLFSILARDHEVIGVDIDRDRISNIQRRITTGSEPSFSEPLLGEYIDNNKENMSLSTDYDDLSSCDIIFIFINTYNTDRDKFTTEDIIRLVNRINEIDSNVLIGVCSTVNPGDMEQLRDIHSNICYIPEFVAQGSVINDFESPEFTLLGSDGLVNTCPLKKVWNKIHDAPIHEVSLKEAEIIKICSNVYFTLGITFANAIGDYCDRFGVNSREVLKIIQENSRDYYRGLGYGGPCFDKDIKMFRRSSEENGSVMSRLIADAVSRCNERTASEWAHTINNSGYDSVGIIGVSYKPDVSYTWNSPVLDIMKGLDPHMNIKVLDENVDLEEIDLEFQICDSIEELLEGTELVFFGVDYSDRYYIPRNIRVIDPWE